MPLSKEQNRERMRKARGAQTGAQNEVGAQEEVHKSVGARAQGAQSLPPTWEYINKHGVPVVQAIVTSLGKYAGEVYLGKVTAKQIRDVIGEGLALVSTRGGVR